MIRGLPYDAEVEYLESTGTQWIDTGIAPTEKTGVECSIFWTTGNYNMNPFGVIEDLPGGRTRFMIQIYYHGSPNAYFGTSLETVRGGAGVGEWNDISLAKGRYVNTGINVNTVSYSPFSFTRFLACGAYNSAVEDVMTNGFVGRMRYFRMTNDGVLVRDFIPVRKGNIGYMYDKVSGKLFGNAGTGEFVIGPDNGRPVLSLHRYGASRFGKVGAGASMLRRGYSARDYVQDGLIAMWDGIENAGWGVHNANATTWKNLGTLGDTYDFTQSLDCSWAKNALMLDTFHSYMECPNMIPRSEIITMESLIRIDDAANITTNNSRIRILMFGDRQYFGGYYYTRRILAWDVYSNDRGWMFSTGEAQPAGQTGTMPPRGSIAFSVTYPTGSDANHVTGSTPTRIIRNGERWNVSQFIDKGDAIGDGQVVGNPQGRNPGNLAYNHGIKGAIHCVRLYSRALTDEEIAHNYKIDKERFNLS